MLIIVLTKEVLCYGSVKSPMEQSQILLGLQIVNLTQVINFVSVSQIMSQAHVFYIRWAGFRHLLVHIHEPSEVRLKAKAMKLRKLSLPQALIHVTCFKQTFEKSKLFVIIIIINKNK